MAKEKKKTPLHKDSIFIKFGIMYIEDVPEFHIDGVACTKEQYKTNLEIALSMTNAHMRSPVLKKRRIARAEKLRNKI